MPFLTIPRAIITNHRIVYAVVIVLSSLIWLLNFNWIYGPLPLQIRIIMILLGAYFISTKLPFVVNRHYLHKHFFRFKRKENLMNWLLVSVLNSAIDIHHHTECSRTRIMLIRSKPPYKNFDRITDRRWIEVLLNFEKLCLYAPC